MLINQRRINNLTTERSRRLGFKIFTLTFEKRPRGVNQNTDNGIADVGSSQNANWLRYKEFFFAREPEI